METLNYTDIRAQLAERRERVEHTLRDNSTDHLVNLLKEIDSALERLDTGSYGFCEVCGDPIEPELLKADALTRVCIGDLSRSQQKMLEDDLTLASKIQHTLLPRNDFKRYGWEIKYHYEPAGPVSGDYCDIVKVSDGGNEIFFIIADVSGKGVSASLLMTHIHAMFHSLVGFGLPVTEIVERANRLLAESTLSSHYATLVLGKVDEEGNMEICNAGHCPPFLVSKNKTYTIPSTGVPIGMFCSSEYTSCSYKLDPGDTLLIYTDGLSEARKDSEEYGTDRILSMFGRTNHLPLASAMESVIRDMKHFIGEYPKVDDMTVMMVRRY